MGSLKTKIVEKKNEILCVDIHAAPKLGNWRNSVPKMNEGYTINQRWFHSGQVSQNPANGFAFLAEELWFSCSLFVQLRWGWYPLLLSLLPKLVWVWVRSPCSLLAHRLWLCDRSEKSVLTSWLPNAILWNILICAFCSAESYTSLCPGFIPLLRSEMSSPKASKALTTWEINMTTILSFFFRLGFCLFRGRRLVPETFVVFS